MFFLSYLYDLLSRDSFPKLLVRVEKLVAAFQRVGIMSREQEHEYRQLSHEAANKSMMYTVEADRAFHIADKLKELISE